MRRAMIDISTKSLMAICWFFEYSTSILNDFTSTSIKVTILSTCSANRIQRVEVSESHWKVSWLNSFICTKIAANTKKNNTRVL